MIDCEYRSTLGICYCLVANLLHRLHKVYFVSNIIESCVCVVPNYLFVLHAWEYV